MALDVIAIAIVVIFVSLGSVHLYWALGGQGARGAAVPELRGSAAFVPGRAATLFVACALFGFAGLVCANAGFIDAPVSPGVIRWCSSGLALMLLLRAVGDFRLIGFFKTIRGTRFAWLDSALYSPLCLLLALGVLAVAWKP